MMLKKFKDNDIASTGAEVTNFRSIQYYTKTTIAR